jgi:PKD repeat protein
MLGALLAPLTSAQVQVDELDLDALKVEVNETLGLADSDIFSLGVTGEAGSDIVVTLPIEGTQFTVQMWPHSVRSDKYKVLVQVADGSMVEAPASEIRTMRGRVLEVPGSLVAGTFNDDGSFFARVNVPGSDTEYWVEQLAERFPGADPTLHVIYRNSDVQHGHGVCGSEAIPQPNTQHDPASFAAGGCGGLCVAELGCDADFEYFQDYGSDVTTVQNRINSIINTMNMQYENEVGIRHDITTLVVRSVSNDPYSGTSASGLLNQIQGVWTGPLSNQPHDVAELFTGRNISGGTIGIAWLSAVCSNLRYSVVENFTSNFSCLTDLSAHELGHNWSAGHCSCNNFTMNPSITCANDFTNGTVNSITNFRNAISNCLDSDGPPTADFVATPTSGGTPLNVQFTDTTTGAKTSWSWTFGDGGTSNQANPSHTYTAEGTYNVSLSVSGPNGSDSITKNGFIDVTPPVTNFTDLGGETIGILGFPTLTASGPLFPGETVDVTLVTANWNATALGWLSFASAPASAFGGTIYPNPPATQLYFTTSGFGSLFLSTGWPTLPSGTDVYIQFLVADPFAQDGVSVSNGVMATTP